MKLNLIALFSFALFINGLAAQDDPPQDVEIIVEDVPIDRETKSPSDKVYELFDVQKLPTFPGGELAMFRFLSDSLRYPTLAKENAITGRVAVSFVVDTLGNRSEIQILRDIGGGCGKEAVRLVRSMPAWIPGEANGRKVKVKYLLPVRFKLD